ncbi:hypothetical protein QBC33DRAFT_540680 [Phialemonium atrogriseum]|uniref:Protein kinase domain-containing protein n=1 Tax=Phialemonium atrogriseum TaxID=1093897 RepID=A0AAJ0FFU6_9PEZI|nr:uncharacterized protein QBC33DRAFT_540680 [Phialemonium atrogriseum]KAK1766931.1 hypothetical protein QBC33DRAFT_540680 [Phialemonium atrogriseum]
MYAKLRDLQGVVLPKYYGQVTWADGTPALLFSDIGGNALCEPAAAEISEDRLRELLTNAYDTMAFYNIAHTDAKLDNFILVGDRIMVVDLEMAEEGRPDQVRSWNDGSIWHLLRTYKDRQGVL